MKKVKKLEKDKFLIVLLSPPPLILIPPIHLPPPLSSPKINEHALRKSLEVIAGVIAGVILQHKNHCITCTVDTTADAAATCEDSPDETRVRTGVSWRCPFSLDKSDSHLWRTR